jgi:hypothetical protein
MMFLFAKGLTWFQVKGLAFLIWGWIFGLVLGVLSVLLIVSLIVGALFGWSAFGLFWLIAISLIILYGISDVIRFRNRLKKLDHLEQIPKYH